jgi:hypothetical protein
MKTEKDTGPNKVLLVLGRRTNAHREDCYPHVKFVSDLQQVPAYPPVKFVRDLQRVPACPPV